MSMNITISGDLGSGKSSATAHLAQLTGFEVISVGTIQRRLAAKYGMNATQFNKYMETHPEIDVECDRMVAELGESENKIFDSRLAWSFVKRSFKVYLKVDTETAIKRIFGDDKRIGESFLSLDEAKASITERRASELLRFESQYGLKLDDEANYDLILHTDNILPEDVATLIAFLYNKHAAGDMHYDRYYKTISPSLLIEANKFFDKP
jgi:cytidylate kinase